MLFLFPALLFAPNKAHTHTSARAHTGWSVMRMESERETTPQLSIWWKPRRGETEGHTLEREVGSGIGERWALAWDGEGQRGMQEGRGS